MAVSNFWNGVTAMRTGTVPMRASASTPFLPNLQFEPRAYLASPHSTVLAQALATEMDSLSILLARVAGQYVRIRSLEGCAGIPKGLLCRTQVGRSCIGRIVITYLRHKPRGIPADLLARLSDQLFQILPVKIPWQRAFGLRLPGI